MGSLHLHPGHGAGLACTECGDVCTLCGPERLTAYNGRRVCTDCKERLQAQRRARWEADHR